MSKAKHGHWIPPPARTTVNKKDNVVKHARHQCIKETSHATTNVRNDDYKPGSSTKNIEAISDSIGTPLPYWDDVKIPETVTMSPQCKRLVNNPYYQYQELKDHVKLICMHHKSLQACSDLLHSKYTSDELLDKTTALSMIHHTDQNIREFESILNKLDDYCVTYDMQLREENTDFEDILTATLATKNLSIVKLLTAYDSVATSLKFLLETTKLPNLNECHEQQAETNTKIEILKEHAAESEAKLEKAENLHLVLQEQIQALQLQNKRQEDNILWMERNIQLKNSQIESLKRKVKYETHVENDVAENERLTQVFEKQRNQHETEKMVLKKALRLQKLKEDELAEKAYNLKLKLDEKEHTLFDIALDRDKWKAQLTSLNNKLVISESRIEELNIKNWDLLNQLNGMKPLGDELQELKTNFEEKDHFSKELLKENESLKKTTAYFEKKYNYTVLELKDFREKAGGDASIALCSQNKDNIPIKIPRSDQLDTTSFTQKNEKDNLIASMQKQIYYLQKEQKEGAFEKQRLVERIESLEGKRNSSYDSKLSYGKNYPNDENSLMDQKQRLVLLNTEEELKIKNLELASIQAKMSETESKYLSQVRDLQTNLDRVTMNYESLQKYVNILKSSYTNVFS